MSDMNVDDMELNAGADKLAPARAAVCSLYDATYRKRERIGGGGVERIQAVGGVFFMKIVNSCFCTCLTIMSRAVYTFEVLVLSPGVTQEKGRHYKKNNLGDKTPEDKVKSSRRKGQCARREKLLKKGVSSSTLVELCDNCSRRGDLLL